MLLQEQANQKKKKKNIASEAPQLDPHTAQPTKGGGVCGSGRTSQGATWPETLSTSDVFPLIADQWMTEYCDMR